MGGNQEREKGIRKSRRIWMTIELLHKMVGATENSGKRKKFLLNLEAPWMEGI